MIRWHQLNRFEWLCSRDETVLGKAYRTAQHRAWNVYRMVRGEFRWIGSALHMHDALKLLA